MWMRAAGVLVALAATAHAKSFVTGPSAVDDSEPPAVLEIGPIGLPFTIETLRVAMHSGELGVTARLTMIVTTEDEPEVRVPIVLPQGAHVTGAALTIGKTQRMVATAWVPEQATAQFETEAYVSRDPILVELAQDGDIDVRAFPLGAKTPAKIEIDIELPPITALSIQSTNTIGIIEANGRRWLPGEDVVIAVPTQRSLLANEKIAARTRVSSVTSLYAGPPPAADPFARQVRRGDHMRRRVMVPVVTIGHVTPVVRETSVDARTVRQAIRLRHAQLQRCYTSVVEYSGGPQGTVMLSLLIDTAGRVAEVRTSGELADERITSCLSEVARGLEFHAGTTAVQVNYPLHFKLRDPRQPSAFPGL
jgi:hypothetical protein